MSELVFEKSPTSNYWFCKTDIMDFAIDLFNGAKQYQIVSVIKDGYLQTEDYDTLELAQKAAERNYSWAKKLQSTMKPLNWDYQKEGETGRLEAEPIFDMKFYIFPRDNCYRAVVCSDTKEDFCTTPCCSIEEGKEKIEILRLGFLLKTQNEINKLFVRIGELEERIKSNQWGE